MSDLIQNEQLLKNPEIWRVVLITICILGIYLSMMILGSSRGKTIPPLYLGILTASLSVILFHRICLLFPIELIGEADLIPCGFLLFLVGPLSYRINFIAVSKIRRSGFILHFLPAVAIFTITLFSQPKTAYINVMGFIHIGIYLLWQIVKILSTKRKIPVRLDHMQQNPSRTRDFMIIQVVLYIGICCASITGNSLLISLVTLASLSLLILLIWIWLMYTAYLSYLDKFNDL